mmetsp:Transcript_33556/g.56179  ORF Transcript_33556/g.56179 Transcript_33556/m.56179 type:complete len:270 (+) Transcript_33556:107-916(+)
MLTDGSLSLRNAGLPGVCRRLVAEDYAASSNSTRDRFWPMNWVATRNGRPRRPPKKPRRFGRSVTVASLKRWLSAASSKSASSSVASPKSASSSAASPKSSSSPSSAASPKSHANSSRTLPSHSSSAARCSSDCKSPPDAAASTDSGSASMPRLPSDAKLASDAAHTLSNSAQLLSKSAQLSPNAGAASASPCVTIERLCQGGSRYRSSQLWAPNDDRFKDRRRASEKTLLEGGDVSRTNAKGPSGQVPGGISRALRLLRRFSRRTVGE